jgi:hypothetical protein
MEAPDGSFATTRKTNVGAAACGSDRTDAMAKWTAVMVALQPRGGIVAANADPAAVVRHGS